MVNAEIGNEIVEKKFTKQSIEGANMSAVENVNKKELPEKRPCKIMVKAEIGNDNVEKKFTKQSIGGANMSAVENVNKKELPEKRPCSE
ncbi:hypothetical protein EB796_015904 [Bugula neritina]|uniref:Uncharacterized protein n=1 Tax=Bugula neritina TaxID=10212 RepID=A0A7J7JIJ8_BUGNE|nr:hypothetical protein EB796_015904 [Bugula neritina]